MDRFQTQALDIVTSPRVREAFDLSKESDRLRASYGKGRFPHQTFKTIMYPWDGEQFLLARRLVEAGVRVVTLRIGDWDHHSADNGDIFFCLRHLLPLLDHGLHALFNDLKARGVDEDVLVVVSASSADARIGQPGPGREHWADAGCAVLFGGGLRMGQVIGQTDARAERSRTGNISFQNIIATIYQTLEFVPPRPWRTTTAGRSSCWMIRSQSGNWWIDYRRAEPHKGPVFRMAGNRPHRPYGARLADADRLARVQPCTRGISFSARESCLASAADRSAPDP